MLELIIIKIIQYLSFQTIDCQLDKLKIDKVYCKHTSFNHNYLTIYKLLVFRWYADYILKAQTLHACILGYLLIIENQIQFFSFFLVSMFSGIKFCKQKQKNMQTMTNYIF